MKSYPQLFGKTLFVDLMMSTLIVVTMLLMVSNSVKKASKEEQEAKLYAEGQFAVIISWDDSSADDIDLYVRNPRGNIVYFNDREAGMMHYEHDDRGIHGESSGEGESTTVRHNEERIILRGVMPGEYVANVMLFERRDSKPTEVKARLVRIKGADNEIATATRTLTGAGDEQTAFRFTFRADQTVTDVNELQVKFVHTAKRGTDAPAGPPPWGGH